MTPPKKPPRKRPQKPVKRQKSQKGSRTPANKLVEAVRAARKALGKRGRPPVWKDGNNELVAKMARLGMTRAEIAQALRISYDTLWEWQRTQEGFSEALNGGSAAADGRVERSLYERAVGYSFESEKIVVAGGKVVRVPIMVHVPPDTTAQIFWLKNRKPEVWRDKVEFHHEHKFNFIGMLPDDKEWTERFASNKEPLVIDQRPEEPTKG